MEYVNQVTAISTKPATCAGNSWPWSRLNQFTDTDTPDKGT
jgi:hypothetical protein